jgi:HEAT repeats
MDDLYTPKSDFVALVASGDVPLTGSNQADGNLRLLIAFTRDEDKSNRDWATMALGMYGPDTEETRKALMVAANDEDCDVRAEAIEALARRDVNLALPLVERDLSQAECGYGVFIAAGLIAEPRLVDALRRFDCDPDPHHASILDAIRACQAGNPVEAWKY